MDKDKIQFATWKCDKDGNPMLFGTFEECFATGIDGVRVDIEQKLKVWSGECFYNREMGIDWLNLLGNKDPNTLIIISNAVKSVALTSKLVKSVINCNVSINDKTRRVKVELVVDTMYGLLEYIQDMNVNHTIEPEYVKLHREVIELIEKVNVSW